MTTAQRRFQMSATRAELLRILALAVGDLPSRIDGGTIAGCTGGVEWTLRIAERPERRIAQLALPMLDVDLECRANDSAQIDRFLARFTLAFQRGGG